MSQPAVAALAPLPFELIYSDGEPLETEWHTWELPLLRELMCQVMEEQGRTDFYAGMNMFVYYSAEQAREVALEVREGKVPRTAFRGPDVFWVGGIVRRNRQAWATTRRRAIWKASIWRFGPTSQRSPTSKGGSGARSSRPSWASGMVS